MADTLKARDHRHAWVKEQQTGHRVCGICNACDGQHSRDTEPLIEAAELVLAARDSVGLGAMSVDLWSAIDTLRFGLKAVGRPWTGTLGAAPDDVENRLDND